MKLMTNEKIVFNGLEKSFVSIFRNPFFLNNLDLVCKYKFGVVKWSSSESRREYWRKRFKDKIMKMFLAFFFKRIFNYVLRNTFNANSKKKEIFFCSIIIRQKGDWLARISNKLGDGDCKIQNVELFIYFVLFQHTNTHIHINHIN